MKFEKFVKSLGTAGTIYERTNGERWLASESCLMRVPYSARSVVAWEIVEMPDEFETIISQIGFKNEAFLVKAHMPIADGSTRDILREYESVKNGYTCIITNADYSLIDRKKDIVEILAVYDLNKDENEVKALLVKNVPVTPEEDYELVGVILPINL